MADFDGDKTNEIVVADMLGEVTVWKGNGTKMPGFPVRAWDTALPDDPHADTPRQLNRILTSPALGDLNQDGVPDIVVGTNEDYDNQGRLYAIDGKTGQFLPGFPVHVNSLYILPMVGSGIPSSPSLADLDGDGVPEIAIGGIGSAVRVYDHLGKPIPTTFPNGRADYGPQSNAQDPGTLTLIATAAFGDVDDDGTLDLVLPTVGLGVPLAMASGGMRHDLEHHLAAWDTKTGKFKPGFPQVIEDYTVLHNPLVADVDGDGHSEVVVASAGYFLHAFRSDGSEATGFPKFTGGWMMAAPALGDLDGDGKLELVEPTREGWLWAWHVGGTTKGRIDWESFHHDARNTGNFAVALDQGTTRVTPGGKPGCSCALGRGADRGGGAVLAITVLVAAAAALAGRKSRRRRKAC
jgi:hypothetical protein